MSQPPNRVVRTSSPTTMNSPAMVTRGMGDRGPAGGRCERPALQRLPALAGSPGGPAGMSSHSSRYTRTPLPPAKVRATKPTRQSSGSTPLYSARPPATPPIILSVRLRRSWGGAGGPGGGGGGSQAGGSSEGGGVAGGGADVMGRSLPIRDPVIHQGKPPSDPGSSSGVITRVGSGSRGATIVA